MRLFVSICDLCATDGTCTPATHKYRGEDNWYDTCDEHLEQIKTVFKEQAGQDVEFEPLPTPGDVTL